MPSPELSEGGRAPQTQRGMEPARQMLGATPLCAVVLRNATTAATGAMRPGK